MKLAFLLLSVLVLQQESEAIGEKDTFARIFDGMMSAINSTTTEILGEFDKAIYKIQDLKTTGIDLVDNTITDAVDLLDALDKKAHDLGIDITACVVACNKKLIIDLKDNATKNLEDTSNRIVNDIIKYKNDTVAYIDTYLDTVSFYSKNFGDCKINLFCMGKVIKDATTASVELIQKLPFFANTVIEKIGKDTDKGVADINSITAEFTTTSSKILTSVTECLASKGVSL